MRQTILTTLVGGVFCIFAMTANAQTPTPPASPAPVPTTEAAPAVPSTAPAAKPARVTYKKGGFAQAGVTANQELEFFKTPGFGVTTALGYQINPQIGVFLRSDFFGIRKDDVTYWDLSLIPSARFTVFDNLYGFGGVGYNFLQAGANSTLMGTPLLFSRSFHSVTAEGGAGYTYFFKEHFGLGFEAGLNYAHVEKGDLAPRDLWRPFLRMGASWQF